MRSTWTFLICWIFLSDCGQKRVTDVSSDTLNTPHFNNTINLETFDTVPSDIEGCSCSFSNTLADANINEYICVTNYSNIAYLKLNGELTKFLLTKSDTLVDGTSIINYENERLKLTIECKFTKTEYESSSTIGTIRLNDKSGEILTRKFVGGCGC